MAHPYSGLLTDLYELTMAAGYVQTGFQARATFELFVREMPPHRSYLVAAGLEQALDYLEQVHFAADEIAYLRRHPAFAHVGEAFFRYLEQFRFTGDVWAMPEGSIFFPSEPLLRVTAPIAEAQILETYLLATLNYQSLVATKAARIVETARGRAIVEFGTRRAHSPQAGVLAGRAAYIGGCIGTSNTLAGKLYGVPVYGTAAHSWVLAFETEELAFRRLQSLLGERTVYIVDTYDTLEGTRTAARLGKPLWGIRLDSGNLVELSRAARAILDEAGLREARIMASGDLNEYKIRELVEAEAPIDAFGVGTELATSADAPNLPAVYKLVELETDGVRRFTAKLSEDKFTLPGAKQVFRYADHDEIARSIECPNCPSDEPVEALLRPVMLKGQLVEPLPGLEQVRTRAAAALARLPESCRRLEDPEPFRIEYTPALLELAEEVRRKSDGALV
jgi:nicotinate phosphoribosyltransferase